MWKEEMMDSQEIHFYQKRNHAEHWEMDNADAIEGGPYPSILHLFSEIPRLTDWYSVVYVDRPTQEVDFRAER
jgi:hypothetical protein